MLVELAAEERAEPVTLAAEERTEPVLEAAAVTEDRMLPIKLLFEGATSETDIFKVFDSEGVSKPAVLAAITGVFCTDVPPITGPSNIPSSKNMMAAVVGWWAFVLLALLQKPYPSCSHLGTGRLGRFHSDLGQQ